MYKFYNETLQPYFNENNVELLYQDSVTSDTPILLRFMNNLSVVRISEILKNQDNFYKHYLGKEIIQLQFPLDIWTANGWKKLSSIIRHKTNKKIYRVRTKLGFVDVTEDHSLIRKNGSEVKPTDLRIGEELLHQRFFPRQTALSFDEIIDFIYNKEPNTLEEKEYFIKGFFMGDGSSGIYNYVKNTQYSWNLSNQDYELLERLKKYCKEVYPHVNFKINDTLKSSTQFRL